MGCGASTNANTTVSPGQAPVPTPRQAETSRDAPPTPVQQQNQQSSNVTAPSTQSQSAPPAAAEPASSPAAITASPDVPPPTAAPEVNAAAPPAAAPAAPEIAEETVNNKPINNNTNPPPPAVAPSVPNPPQPITGHGAQFHIEEEEMRDVEKAWEAAEKTLCFEEASDTHPSAPQRRGWRTCRVFVSSTFADMFAERELLIKHCFPELRSWCQARKLHLIECDLRWGVPKDSTSENTLRTCLSEVDRCRDDNGNPFFLNLLSERYGWIPGPSEVPEGVAKQYQWIDGFSVTAMEIMHGAYRDCNPNAIFFIRSPDFIKDLPAEYVPQFVDDASFRKAHLKELKSRVAQRFPEDRVVHYNPSVDADWLKAPSGKVPLVNMFDLSRKALEFLRTRIALQYPLDPHPPDRLEADRLAHEAFMSSRSEVVLGRDDVFLRIRKYLMSTTNCQPLVLVGHPGCGKSAVMARAASDVIDAMEAAKGGGGDGGGGLKRQSSLARTGSGEPAKPLPTFAQVLFHFIGAAPGSTDLVRLLSRLFNLLSPGEIPKDAETLVRSIPVIMSEGAWSRGKNVTKYAVFIDALNQLDTDDEAQMLRWLPSVLSPHLRLIVSTIDGSDCHEMLKKRSPPLTFVEVGPLGKDICAGIASTMLGKYNKRLDEAQLDSLLAKSDSANPLWLATACEELRVFGIFEQVTAKISAMPGDLLSLLEAVLARLETENDRPIIIAACCFVECSRHGLLESELLELLAMVEMDSLLPDEVALSSANTEGSGKKSDNGSGSGNGNGGQGETSADAEEAEEQEEHMRDELKKKKKQAYREDEEEDADKSGEKKKKFKERARLPAAVWAQVPRALGALMRPCGGEGEGRMDFFHRAVSKAVRRRHLTRENKDLQERLFAFWHGRLVTYFEDSSDEARKAEELPYHLERIFDTNKLARVLVEWGMFERLFTEDNKMDLFKSWRAAGGYTVASQLYRKSFEGMTDNTDGHLAHKLVLISDFLLDVLDVNGAIAELERALEMETERCGATSKEVALILLQLARTYRKGILTHQRLNPESAQMGKKLLTVARQCLPLLKKHNNEGVLNEQLREALILVAAGAGSVVDHLSNVHSFTYSEEPDDLLSEAKKMLEEAENLVKSASQGDLAAAEVMMARGLIGYNQDDYPTSQKFYMQAATLRQSRLGGGHLLVAQAYHRCGRAYEMGRNTKVAKDFYDKSHKIFSALLGDEHSDTKMALQDLKDVS